MTLQSRREPAVTRSAPITPPPVELSREIATGRFYAILADCSDFDDGFCITKSLKVNTSDFKGTYYKKAEGQAESSVVLYEETKQTALFDYRTVLHELISVKIVDSCKKIDLDEIEDIIVSANEVS